VWLGNIVLMLACFGSAFGQSLAVTVRTPDGKPVPGASVTLGAADRSIQAADTNESGMARFPAVEPGRHALSIVARGFDNLTTNIDVDPGTTGETAIEAILNTIHTESITVQGVIETPLEEANTPSVLERRQIKNMPDQPRTVTDALPLVPGIVRLPDGQLRLAGSGEHRNALLVNDTSATDPATGQFGATLPIDSIRSMSVLSSPFLAEFGNFTGDVVSVETRKGGDKWAYELNDPLPEFRWRSWHMVGLRSSTPRFNFGGPVVRNRLFLFESVQYEMRASPVITLPFPNNETRREGYNSLTALDYTINSANVVTATMHVADQHTRFANLDFFDPQPVSPDTANTTYSAQVTEHASLRGTLLDSSLAAGSFHAAVWAQGDLPMTLTPEGNGGNYFSRQTRTSSRFEWRETWSISRQAWGTHNLKFGSLAGGTAEHGLLKDRPVNIVDTGGTLLETIDFTPGREFSRTDVESAFFAQDQWVMGSRFSFTYGVRVEQQEVTDVFRIGPRAGVVWSPFAGGRTVLRAGSGVFYDRVPLNVYGFAYYPDEIITLFNPDGTIRGGPNRYFNLTEPAAPHHSPLIYRDKNAAGNFAPYSINLNFQVEQILTPRIRLRADYLRSRSEGLVTLVPEVTDTTHAFLLNGNGYADLRQFELTAAAGAWKESQAFISYVHSRSTGNLNEFSNYLANFPPAVILPDARTFLPGDTPNRVLAWGTIALPRKIRLTPKVEYRSGFPWSVYNAAQNYAGVPNRNRFPGFFSVDVRVTEDIRVTAKYSFRIGVSGSNLTNHFNPLSVHANDGDPAYGLFFGEYHRRYTADFDVLF
jgi:hypothetical protein